MKVSEWKPGKPVDLEYGGIEMRSLKGSDIDERFVERMRDESVNQHVFLPKKFTRDQFASFVDTHLNKRSFFLGIFPKGTGNCIGYRRIVIDKHGVAVQTIMIFDKAYWRLGINSIASYMAAKFLFETLKVPRFEARIYADNEPTKRFLEKSQYKYEGTLRKSEGDGKGGRRDVLIIWPAARGVDRQTSGKTFAAAESRYLAKYGVKRRTSDF